MLPWTKKYQPKGLAGVQGQDKVMQELVNFVTNFNPKKKTGKKAIIIYGASGCGKTSSVYALANHFDYEVMEINASDFRNKAQIESILGAACKQMSLFSKGKIILVDELDGISGQKDRGGVSAITKLLGETNFPIIITANDPYDKKFSTLRKKTTLIEFNTLSYLSILIVLKKVCEKENLTYTESALKSLSRRCGGDLRGAIIDLQILTVGTNNLDEVALETLGDRRQLESMMEALIKIFKSSDPNIAITALNNVDEDLDKSFLWIDENLPVEYEKGADLARAYDALSKADVYRGRIRKWQYWRFLVYVNAMMTAGVAVAKDEKYKKFVKYKPTSRILKLWFAKQRNAKRNAIAAKIAGNTHASMRDTVQNTLPFVKHIFKTNDKMADNIANELEFNSDEIEWLKR